MTTPPSPPLPAKKNVDDLSVPVMTTLNAEEVTPQAHLTSDQAPATTKAAGLLAAKLAVILNELPNVANTQPAFNPPADGPMPGNPSPSSEPPTPMKTSHFRAALLASTLKKESAWTAPMATPAVGPTSPPVRINRLTGKPFGYMPGDAQPAAQPAQPAPVTPPYPGNQAIDAYNQSVTDYHTAPVANSPEQERAALAERNQNSAHAFEVRNQALEQVNSRLDTSRLRSLDLSNPAQAAQERQALKQQYGFHPSTDTMSARYAPSPYAQQAARNLTASIPPAGSPPSSGYRVGGTGPGGGRVINVRPAAPQGSQMLRGIFRSQPRLAGPRFAGFRR